MLLPRRTIAAIQSYLSPPLDRSTVVAVYEAIDIFVARIALQNKRSDLALRRESDGRDVAMLVESSCVPADAAADDDEVSMSSVESVLSTASATAVRNNGASLVWHTKEMRPKQHIAVDRLLFDASSDGKLLLVDRTGGGKSLTMQMALTMSAGIALVIGPLLALTAD